MTAQLLLIEDVEDLGRSGEIVTVKPGYARNFLLPQRLAVVADKRAVRMQERLKEERAKKAAVDLKASQEAAQALEGKVLTKEVKVDGEGHMYGSVTLLEIKQMIEDEFKIELEKRAVQLKHPVKEIGVFPVPLRLKEGVECTVQLKVIAEQTLELPQQQEG